MQVSIEQRDRYAVVRISGRPSLAQFVALIEQAARQSKSWPHRRAVVDLRGVETMKAVTDHVAIGRAVVEQLAHLEKLASIVPANRVTGISRKVAQEGGVNLAVFIDEAEAVRWLLAD